MSQRRAATSTSGSSSPSPACSPSRRADDLRQAAAYTPPERILVETDAPFLAPVPHRGQRNEPAFITRTLDTLAQVRGISASNAAELTTANALRLFRIDLG